MLDRPSVDFVVPFKGSREELTELLDRMASLRLGADDTMTVVDNRPPGTVPPVQDPRVVVAPDVQTPGYARNAGAERGSAEWLIFVDADVVPPPGLADAYFAEQPVADDVAVVAGAVHDQEPSPARRVSPAARYAFLRESMAQSTTHAQLGPFAKTANAAVRRQAFEAVGGFRSRLVSGEDVDLCYRLRDAGWRLEFSDRAFVEHRGRPTIRALLAQQTRHGAGTAWLDVEYPGFSPPFRWSSLVVSVARGLVKGGLARVRGDRDRSIVEVLDPLTALAFHLGRFRPNVREP